MTIRNLNTIDVIYDDKAYGQIIDPNQWNDNFKKIEENINNNVVSLLSDEGSQLLGSAILTGLGDDTALTVFAQLSKVVEHILNRYTKSESDALLAGGTNNLVKEVDVNLTTGVITITKKDNTTVSFDTALEKVPATFEIIESAGAYYLKITNTDGTSTQTDLTNLMDVYNYTNTDTVSFTKTGTGNVKTITAEVRDASIGLEKMSITLVSQFESWATTATNGAATATTQAGIATTKAGEAATSAATAVTKATEASVSAQTAATKAGDANSSAANALSSANSAAASASTATTKASEAAASATAANTSKNQAATSATNAATSEANALGSKNAAAVSATDANTKATAAATSATNANNSANAAADSADSASGSAATAVTKANEADASADAAAASASTATTKAGEAAASATTATTKATEAATSATNAATSEANALVSKNAAAASATSANTSKTQAATSATNANNSANAAASSAASAAGSASTATTKAGEADASADAAALSAASAQGIDTLSRSYAVGGTGTRPGEDADNAKYYKDQAAAIVGGDYATKAEVQALADARGFYVIRNWADFLAVCRLEELNKHVCVSPEELMVPVGTTTVPLVGNVIIHPTGNNEGLALGISGDTTLIFENIQSWPEVQIRGASYGVPFIVGSVGGSNHSLTIQQQIGDVSFIFPAVVVYGAAVNMTNVTVYAELLEKVEGSTFTGTALHLNSGWYSGSIIGLDNKVDTVAGKQLSTEDYTTAEKDKLAGIEAGATNYQHPANHAPSIIVQDANNRFVTDSDKAAWDGKASFKNGSGTFPAGTTHTVTDAFITANTLVTISPTGNKTQNWSVVSNNGNFVITAEAAEPSSVTFDWGAVK